MMFLFLLIRFFEKRPDTENNRLLLNKVVSILRDLESD